MLRLLLTSLEAGTRASSGTKTWAARFISSSSSSIASSSSFSPPPPPPSSSSFSSPSSLFDRLGEVLSPELVAGSLVSKGYAVVDNALDAETCRRLRGEIDALKAAGLLRANATFLVKGKSSSSSSSSSSEGDAKDSSSSSSSSPPPPSLLSSATLLEKRGIWETDSWGDAAVAAAAPLLSSAGGLSGRGGGGGAGSLAALLSVLCPERFSLSGPAILKAQLNDGLERGGGGGGEEEGEEKRRASSSSSSSPPPREPFSSLSSSSSSSSPSPSFPCFPLHFDSDESVDGRRVTAIFYLSEKMKSKERGEKEAGGELLLWPNIFSSSPTQQQGSGNHHLLPLAIPPEEGRLVLFSACRMPHAVAPSRRRRHCFTVWLSEGEEERRRRERAGEGGGEKRDDDIDTRRERVLSSAAGRRAVARVLLSASWRRSLVAAHPPGPALDAALETHDGDTRKLAQALKEARVVEEVVVGGGEEEEGTRWELSRRRGGGGAENDDDSPMLWF